MWWSGLSKMASTNLTDSARIVLEAACQYTHTQARILFYGGGTFVLFSVLSGLVVVMLRAIFVHTLSLVVPVLLYWLLQSMFWMNAMTAGTSSWLTACETFSNQIVFENAVVSLVKNHDVIDFIMDECKLCRHFVWVLMGPRLMVCFLVFCW